MMFQVSFGDMIACDNENVSPVTAFYLFLMLVEGFFHTSAYMCLSSNQLPEVRLGIVVCWSSWSENLTSEVTFSFVRPAPNLFQVLYFYTTVEILN